MRDRDASPGRKPRSRAALVLGLLAAIEAVAIVALLLTRGSGAEGTPAFAGGHDSTILPPRFSAPVADGPGDSTAGRTAVDPGAERLQPASTDGPSPEPLVPPASSGGDVGIVLCGTVAAEDGHLLAHVEMELSPSDARVRVNRGVYAVAGLAPGPLNVSCSAPGFMPQTVAIQLDAARPVEHLDFLLALAPSIPVRFRSQDGWPLFELLDQAKVPGRLEPIVTHEPLTGDVLAAIPHLANWTRFSETEDPTDSQAALIATGWDGVLELSVPLPVWVSATWDHRVLAAEPVVNGEAGVSFVIPIETFLGALCTVRARVVDVADGKPVPGALGQLDNKQYVPFDAQASVVFERVPSGSHTLFIHPPGAWMSLGESLMMPGAAQADFGEVSLPLALAPGQSLDLGDIPLQRTVMVRGHVVDVAGRSIAVPVTADRIDIDPKAPLAGRTYRARVTDGDGSFSIRLVPGRWSFQAGVQAPDLPPAIVDVRGEIESLRLVGAGVPIQK